MKQCRGDIVTNRVTKYNGDFLVGFFKRIGFIAPGEDDHGSIYGGSQPRDVSMPEQSSSLSGDHEIVRVCLPCLDRTLCYVSRSISPAASQLPNSMPRKLKFRTFC